MAIYSKDAADSQADLTKILDRGGRIEEYACCKSQRKTLEEIRDRGFALSKELSLARANVHDTRLLFSDSEDNMDEASRP